MRVNGDFDDVQSLVVHLGKLCDDKDVFIDKEDQLQPGIIVLIDGVDWELLSRE